MVKTPSRHRPPPPPPVDGRWYVRMPPEARSGRFAVDAVFVIFFLSATIYVRHLVPIPETCKPWSSHCTPAAAFERLLSLWQKRVRQTATATQTGARILAIVLQQVEKLVASTRSIMNGLESVGSADYMPTVKEIFDKAAETDGAAREDCDGRAVIAASLMKRLGYDARSWPTFDTCGS